MHIEMWWIWMALATILLIAEIFTAGFFLLWFSIGAAGAGVLAMLDVNRPAQLTVFILLSGILYVFGRRFADRVTANQPPGIGADRLIGQLGVVVEGIDNNAGKGRIKVGSDEWRALSETGKIIKTNDMVEVIKIDGTKAIVKLMKKGE